ncbi:hypothetical protein BJX62DRAFT_79376 [Aspergillus germanicus]
MHVRWRGDPQSWSRSRGLSPGTPTRSDLPFLLRWPDRIYLIDDSKLILAYQSVGLALGGLQACSWAPRGVGGFPRCRLSRWVLSQP